jgi:hypothetical protein
VGRPSDLSQHRKKLEELWCAVLAHRDRHGDFAAANWRKHKPKDCKRNFDQLFNHKLGLGEFFRFALLFRTLQNNKNAKTTFANVMGCRNDPGPFIAHMSDSARIGHANNDCRSNRDLLKGMLAALGCPCGDADLENLWNCALFELDAISRFLELLASPSAVVAGGANVPPGPRLILDGRKDWLLELHALMQREAPEHRLIWVSAADMYDGLAALADDLVDKPPQDLHVRAIALDRLHSPDSDFVSLDDVVATLEVMSRVQLTSEEKRSKKRAERPLSRLRVAEILSTVRSRMASNALWFVFYVYCVPDTPLTGAVIESIRDDPLPLVLSNLIRPCLVDDFNKVPDSLAKAGVVVLADGPPPALFEPFIRSGQLVMPLPQSNNDDERWYDMVDEFLKNRHFRSEAVSTLWRSEYKHHFLHESVGYLFDQALCLFSGSPVSTVPVAKKICAELKLPLVDLFVPLGVQLKASETLLRIQKASRAAITAFDRALKHALETGTISQQDVDLLGLVALAPAGLRHSTLTTCSNYLERKGVTDPAASVNTLLDRFGCLLLSGRDELHPDERNSRADSVDFKNQAVHDAMCEWVELSRLSKDAEERQRPLRLHRVLADIALSQASRILYRTPAESLLELRSFRTVLQCIYHGLLSLGIASGKAKATLGNTTHLAPCLSGTDSDVWRYLVQTLLHGVLEDIPRWLLSRQYLNTELKLALHVLAFDPFLAVRPTLYARSQWRKATQRETVAHALESLVAKHTADVTLSLHPTALRGDTNVPSGTKDYLGIEVAFAIAHAAADLSMHKLARDLLQVIAKAFPSRANDGVQPSRVRPSIKLLLECDLAESDHEIDFTRWFDEFVGGKRQHARAVLVGPRELDVKTITHEFEDSPTLVRSYLDLLVRRGVHLFYAAERALLDVESENDASRRHSAINQAADTYLRAYTVFQCAITARGCLPAYEPQRRRESSSAVGARTYIWCCLRLAKLHSFHAPGTSLALHKAPNGAQLISNAEVHFERLSREVFRFERERIECRILRAEMLCAQYRRAKDRYFVGALSDASAILTEVDELLCTVRCPATLHVRFLAARTRLLCSTRASLPPNDSALRMHLERDFNTARNIVQRLAPKAHSSRYHPYSLLLAELDILRKQSLKPPHEVKF